MIGWAWYEREAKGRHYTWEGALLSPAAILHEMLCTGIKKIFLCFWQSTENDFGFTWVEKETKLYSINLKIESLQAVTI